MGYLSAALAALVGYGATLTAANMAATALFREPRGSTPGVAPTVRKDAVAIGKSALPPHVRDEIVHRLRSGELSNRKVRQLMAEFPQVKSALDALAHAYGQKGHIDYVGPSYEAARYKFPITKNPGTGSAPAKKLASAITEVAANAQGAHSPQIARPRTGNPTVDGLVGIEPNPGPKKGKAGKKAKAVSKREPHLGTATPSFGAVGTAMATSQHNKPLFFSSGRSGRFLGSEATWFRGRTLIVIARFFQGTWRLSGVATPNDLQEELLINPRIMCQTANWSNPVNVVPLTRIAGAYRKFCFTRLKFEYVPMSAATTEPFPIAMAFIPDAATILSTTSSIKTLSHLAQFESSAYGPYWSSHCIDATSVLDRSRWYNTEYDEGANGVTNAPTTLQGLFTINARDQVAPNTLTVTNVGLIVAEFELALCDIGPEQTGSLPSLGALSKDEVDLVLASRRGKEPVEVPASAPSAANGSSFVTTPGACSGSNVTGFSIFGTRK